MKSQICLSCKHYSLRSAEYGLCRVQADQAREERPRVDPQQSCPQWVDAEQQYSIRIGWLKHQAKA